MNILQKPYGVDAIAAIVLTILMIALPRSPLASEEHQSPRVAPPELPQAQVEYPLPADYDGVCLGGGGRYLVFRFPSLQQLGVFDVSQAKMTGLIPSGAPDAPFAAGREVLVIAQTSGQIETFDLATLEKRQSVKLESSGAPVLLAMGYDSAGPILLGWDKQQVGDSHLPARMALLDSETLQPLDLETDQTPRIEPEKQTVVRASADGRTFGFWRRRTSPAGMQVLRLTDRKARVRYEHDSNGYVRPNASGRWVYTANGVFHTNLEPYQPAERNGESGKTSPFSAVPAVRGPFYLGVSHTKGPRQNPNPEARSVGVFLENTHEQLAALSDVRVRERDVEDREARGAVSLDMRMFLIPEAKVLITLPESNQIVLRSFDLEKELKASGQEYLFVASQAPSVVRLGEPMEYAVQTLSKAGGLKYQLETGPKGMTISEDGVVRWTPQVRPMGGVAEIVLSVRDASGKQASHAFQLEVERNATVDPQAPPLLQANQRLWEITGGDVVALVAKGGPSHALLQRNRILLLAEDGCTIAQNIPLSKPYLAIGLRDKYLVGATDSSVDIIDRRSAEVIRSMTLPVGPVLDLALHPTAPISYVAVKNPNVFPSARFIIFDESSGKGRQSEVFIGSRVAVDATGRNLFAAFDDAVVVGRDFLGMPAFAPVGGLFRYRLLDPSNPKMEDENTDPGSSRRGLRIAPDNSQIVNVAAEGWGKLHGWSCEDFSELPIVYDLGVEDSEANDLAFHPLLPLAAAFGQGGVRLFDRRTGAPRSDNVAFDQETLVRADRKQLWFSPDGRNLVVLLTVNAIPYLYPLELPLSEAERNQLEEARKNSAPAPAKEAAPAAKAPLASLDALRGGAGVAMSAAQINQRFSDAVVVIQSGDGSGTGFVVGSDGWIITCAHCLFAGRPVTVAYRTSTDAGTTEHLAQAKVIRSDDERDLALLKIDPERRMRSVRLASASSSSGEGVTVIGNPGLGKAVLNHTVTQGVISDPRRQFEGAEFLQFTAAINAGSSGGPVFNDRALVVGMVVAKAHLEGTGFAIPTSDIMAFLAKSASLDGEDWRLRRTWTDATRQYNIDALFVDVRNGHARLQKIDSKDIITVPLERLSPGDQGLLNGLSGAADEK